MEQFSYNVTDAKDCVPAKDNLSEPNCTKVTNGSFTGIGATFPQLVQGIFAGNLLPRYVQITYSRNELRVEFRGPKTMTTKVIEVVDWVSF